MLPDTEPGARPAPRVALPTTMTAGDCTVEMLAAAGVADVVQVDYAGGPVWVVCSPELARAALADTRLTKDATEAPPWLTDDSGLIGSPETAAAPSLITSDGDVHARLRGLHRDMFSTRTVADWSDGIEQIARRLFDRVEAAGADGSSVDLVAELTYPLPLAVFCMVLGLPERVHPALRRASEDITYGTDPAVRGRGVATLFGSVAACLEHPEQLSPGLVTTLLELPDVTTTEVVTWAAGLVLPGHESTASLLASALWEALRVPPERRPATADAVRDWIEETLRVHPPFMTTTWRFATERRVLGGYEIPEGSPVLVNIPAANQRDIGAIFTPGQPARHLSFGAGAHFCLGANLARLESGIALGGFVARFPKAALHEPAPRWQSDMTVRRLSTLQIHPSGA